MWPNPWWHPKARYGTDLASGDGFFLTAHGMTCRLRVDWDVRFVEGVQLPDAAIGFPLRLINRIYMIHLCNLFALQHTTTGIVWF